MHWLILTNALVPAYPLLENWKIGKSLWITPFFPYKSTTYGVPIVHRNIGKSVNPFQKLENSGYPEPLNNSLLIPVFQTLIPIGTPNWNIGTTSHA
jgi:hypothetical protein